MSMSEADGSHPGDRRTIDFPPAVPTRSSSLSAPTSRNASRTASLTAESLQAHNALQLKHGQQVLEGVQRMLETLQVEKLQPQPQPQQNGTIGPINREMSKTFSNFEMDQFRPEILIRRPTSVKSKLSDEARKSRAYPDSQDTREDHEERLQVDRYGDPFFGRRLSVQHTPFSQVSVDTTGTSHAEVSEAVAISIYPHQNDSVMIVDHSTKPSESSSMDRSRSTDAEMPGFWTTDANGFTPVTPPQIFSMEDVDSPLRNPRAPPQPPSMPPAIQFIPATPSGLTPAVEKDKQLGNYYEMTEEKPKRRPSLLQRTLSRGRQSYYGPSPARRPSLLRRTLSLSRRGSRTQGNWDDEDRPGLRRHSTADDAPADETLLHPFWRPAYADESESDSEDDWPDERSGGRTYRYPLVDNRPSRPRRSASLSARMKRTFAILPIQDDYEDGRDALDRRTIRRTPSGNLRVMKFRRSLESMPRLLPNGGRPYTSSGDGGGQGRQFRFWRLTKRSSDALRRNGFLPTLGNKINITRRMSERRREKRTQELRRMISGPREVRDGVGDVIRRNSHRETCQPQPRHT